MEIPSKYKPRAEGGKRRNYGRQHQNWESLFTKKTKNLNNTMGDWWGGGWIVRRPPSPNRNLKYTKAIVNQSLQTHQVLLC